MKLVNLERSKALMPLSAQWQKLSNSFSSSVVSSARHASSPSRRSKVISFRVSLVLIGRQDYVAWRQLEGDRRF